jgi:uncharacterized protein with FMN-binding domain
MLLVKLDSPSSANIGSAKIGRAVGGGTDPAQLPSTTTAARQTPPTFGQRPAFGGDDGGGDDGEGDDGGGFAPRQPAQQPAQAPATTAATAAAGSSTACTGKAVDGAAVNTRWGPVQVRAKFTTDGRLCDVTPLQYPNDRQRSMFINQQALPILHDLAVRANGVGFNSVSGATITSGGYKSSLQSALDGR